MAIKTTPINQESATDKATSLGWWLLLFVNVTVIVIVLVLIVLDVWWWELGIVKLLLQIGILLGLVGIYPATYLAYLKYREAPQKAQLKDDFRLLGLVSEQDLDETVQTLYRTVYHPIQYIMFIVLIVIITLLVIGGFLERESLLFTTTEQAQLVFFAFLGAYFFSIGEMIRRYNTFDLLPQVFSSILVRMVSAMLLVYVGAALILGPFDWLQAVDTRAEAIDLRSQATALREDAMAMLTGNRVEQIDIPASSEGSGITADNSTGDGATNDGSTIDSEGATNNQDSASDNTGIPASDSESSTAQTLPFLAEAERLEAAADNLEAQVQDVFGNGSEGWMTMGLLLAFVIGAFPKYGMQWFTATVTKAFSGFQTDLQRQRPLSQIVGISPWHEARLIEMGLDDAQNLATADIRKLLLTTQFDTQQIINWIDQAILYVKVNDRLETFRRVGITSFYELKALVSKEEGDQHGKDNKTKDAPPEPRQRPLFSLGFSDEMDLNRLTDSSNYPNFAHIVQYYYNTEMVVRQRALQGRNIVISDQNSLAQSIVVDGSNQHEQVDKDHWEAEVKRCKPLVALNPKHVEPHLRLAYAYYWLDDVEKAQKCFKQVCNSVPPMADAYIGMGLLELKAGMDAKPKSQDSTKAVESQDSTKRIKDTDCYLEAIRYFTSALGINATLASVYNNRGLAYMKLNYLDQALKDLNRAVELNDDLHTAYLNRGSVYLAHADFEESAHTAFLRAERDLQIAYILGSRSPTLWLCWGTALIGLEQYEEAIEKLSQAVLQKTDLAYAYSRRGYAYMQLGPRYYEQARRDLTTALKKKECNEATTHANLGLLEAYKGNDECAVKKYCEALELDKLSRTIRYNRAVSYIGLGMVNSAKCDLEEVVKYAPEDCKDFNLAMEVLCRLWRQPRQAGSIATEDNGTDSALDNSSGTQSGLGETGEAVVHGDPNRAIVESENGVTPQTASTTENATVENVASVEQPATDAACGVKDIENQNLVEQALPYVDTSGGAYVGCRVSTGGGEFVGRDMSKSSEASYSQDRAIQQNVRVNLYGAQEIKWAALGSGASSDTVKKLEEFSAKVAKDLVKEASELATQLFAELACCAARKEKDLRIAELCERSLANSPVLSHLLLQILTDPAVTSTYGPATRYVLRKWDCANKCTTNGHNRTISW